MSYRPNPWRDAPAWAKELRNLAHDILSTTELNVELQVITMGIAQDLEDEVAAQTTVISSVEVFIQNTIDALRAAGNDQAKLAAVLTSLQGNKTRLGALIVENTPAAPEVTEPTPAPA